MPADVARLAMWSGPRNISTAMMRAWDSRADCLVVDEPLYAHYLHATGLDHPMRDEVVAAGQTDWRLVVLELLGPVPEGVRVYYHKQMAHHVTAGMERGWIAGLTNVLLIREPGEVVASYLRSRSKVTAHDIGLLQQESMYDELVAAGAPPLVIDTADFLRDPRGQLAALCQRIGVPYTEAMTAWPAGRRDSDGVWAPHWYDAVWRSTGFEPYRARKIDLTGPAAAVAEACRPAYERLHALRWTP